MAHEMIFFQNMILDNAFDEEEEMEDEEEESESADIDDELIGELGDDALDDELIEGEIDPLLKRDESGFGETDEREDGEKDKTVFDDEEEDEEDMDYDSFDDRDEM